MTRPISQDDPTDSDSPTDSDLAIANAERLLADGRADEAIEFLSDHNRRDRDPLVEQHLVLLRHNAYACIDKTPPAPRQPHENRRVGGGQLCSVGPDELTVESLREGLETSGCLLVEGLIDEPEAERLRHGIDRALDAFDAGNSGSRVRDDRGWYTPFVVEEGRYRIGGRRGWMRESGGVWAVDSPTMLFEVCELVDRTGIAELVTKHLGERPVLSANKCNLRRVPVDSATNWHQDGAFLGTEVRTVNFWLTLSDCGVDAPGLELVPQRLEHVLETGTEGAIFDWSVGEPVVDSLETAPICPSFAAGDVLLFDQYFLHRTAIGDQMTNERYAIESWFFAPSAYPEGQIPIVY